MAQQKHDNGTVDWGRVGVEAAIGAIPIPGGGGAAAGREAAETAGREALETTGREAAEQAARTTGERELSTIGTDAAENLGDDTARVAHDACNGAACFTGDTPVLMADGSSKPIQDVQPGDQVTAWDPDTDTTQPRTVTRTWTHENVETLVVGLEDGGQVETTTGHPFLTKDHGWTPAGHLKPGDLLHTPDNTWVTVQSIETTGHTHTVHNLEIEDLHTYHVLAGTTWTTVHNSCTPKPGSQYDQPIGPVQEDAWKTIDHVDQKGTPLPGHKGGRPWMNSNNQLPSADRAGNPISYREYDVSPNVKGTPRDAKRVVMGDDGSAYYTTDHYESFIEVRESPR